MYNLFQEHLIDLLNCVLIMLKNLTD